MPFQSTNIQFQQAPAVQGDFATNNPRSVVPTPDGGAFISTNNLIIGNFGWINTADPSGRSIVNSYSALPSIVPDGFIARQEQGLITTFLTEFGLTMVGGQPLVLFTMGDFWMLVNVNPAVRGNKVFANLTNGTMQPAPTGTVIAGYIETKYVITVAANVGELAVMTYTP